MITVRRSEDRGFADHGWLKTHHTFSFADYYDQKFMGFRSLRVINEDYVDAGNGFGTHPHRDMEIITYILEGSLAHKDSMGHTEEIIPGFVQAMSAGTGVQHSEFNPSKTAPVHLLQIWILPAHRGGKPRYDQKFFPNEERTNKLCLVASNDGANGSLQIGQDAKVYASILNSGSTIQHELAAGRSGWLQVARGAVTLNGTKLNAGDGAAIEQEQQLAIAANADSELLLFDLV